MRPFLRQVIHFKRGLPCLGPFFVAVHGVMSRGRRAFWVELPGPGAIVAAGGA